MANLMRTSNPALNEKAFQGQAAFGEAMTLQGTVNKTGVLLLCVVVGAAWTWGMSHSETPEAAIPSRASIGGFATHQPNPRLLTLLAKQCGVSPDAFPPICRTAGNLGSSMCGAALHAALRNEEERKAGHRRPIFLASLGPGLLFGGSWLAPA